MTGSIVIKSQEIYEETFYITATEKSTTDSLQRYFTYSIEDKNGKGIQDIRLLRQKTYKFTINNYDTVVERRAANVGWALHLISRDSNDVELETIKIDTDQESRLIHVKDTVSYYDFNTHNNFNTHNIKIFKIFTNSLYNLTDIFHSVLPLLHVNAEYINNEFVYSIINYESLTYDNLNNPDNTLIVGTTYKIVFDPDLQDVVNDNNKNQWNLTIELNIAAGITEIININYEHNTLITVPTNTQACRYWKTSDFSQIPIHFRLMSPLDHYLKTESDITTIKSEINTNETNITLLNATINTLTSEINTMKETINTLNTNI